MHMYMHIYMYIHTYTHTYSRIFNYTPIYIHIHTYIYTYTFAYTFIVKHASHETHFEEAGYIGGKTLGKHMRGRMSRPSPPLGTGPVPVDRGVAWVRVGGEKTWAKKANAPQSKKQNFRLQPKIKGGQKNNPWCLNSNVHCAALCEAGVCLVAGFWASASLELICVYMYIYI